MALLPPLVCKECGHVNEGERVYCHGCGVKLDREVLVAQQQQQAPMPQAVRHKAKKIMSPGDGFWRRTWRILWKTIALAAITAIVICAALPPEWAATGTKEAEMDAPPLDVYLEKLVVLPAGQRISMTEAQVNAYLQREHFKKVPDWLTQWIPLQRVFVNFSKEQTRITLQASLAGYPIYAELSFQLGTNKKTGLTTDCTGGYIGRLPLPQQIVEQAVEMLPILLSSFQHEWQLLGKIGSVEVGDGQIILSSRGPDVPPPAKNLPPIHFGESLHLGAPAKGSPAGRPFL